MSTAPLYLPASLEPAILSGTIQREPYSFVISSQFLQEGTQITMAFSKHTESAEYPLVDLSHSLVNYLARNIATFRLGGTVIGALFCTDGHGLRYGPGDKRSITPPIDLTLFKRVTVIVPTEYFFSISKLFHKLCLPQEIEIIYQEINRVPTDQDFIISSLIYQDLRQALCCLTMTIKLYVSVAYRNARGLLSQLSTAPEPPGVCSFSGLDQDEQQVLSVAGVLWALVHAIGTGARCNRRIFTHLEEFSIRCPKLVHVSEEQEAVVKRMMARVLDVLARQKPGPSQPVFDVKLGHDRAQSCYLHSIRV